ncbi:hypothetical protein RFI_02189 [Reticulomyxa filosa]|uniref:CLASP N-terminal domain-containing protein n=1 Tax=Reticulomyxa filosa TaxID=46433 RepID=X6P8Q7_RETFI|nr:hypothetical protein RFI_02189 [Reticulomyxa filosa]|eukprot:ETO34895.1 hypothetical protein RFI_02189 [Reticulomyxa filosa]
MEYLQMVLEVYKNCFVNCNLDNHWDEIVTCIQNGVCDASESVRYASRRAVWALSAIDSDKTQEMISKLDAVNQKRVLKEQNEYQPFPPPIGKGHQTDRRGGVRNPKIRFSGTIGNTNENSENKNTMNRPQSANAPKVGHRASIPKPGYKKNEAKPFFFF